MDTKLKSFKYAMFFKVIAFLLIAASLTTAVVEIQYLAFSDIAMESILVPSYRDSTQFLQRDASSAIYSLSSAINGDVVSNLGDHYYYYYEDQMGSHTNLASGDDSFFKEYTGKMFILNNGYWEYNGDLNRTYLNGFVKSDVNAYLVFSTDYMIDAQKEWQSDRESALPVVYSMIGAILGSILLLIYLTITVGKSYKDDVIHLNFFDLIPSDVFLVIYAALTGICFMMLDNTLGYRTYYISEMMTFLVISGMLFFIFMVLSGVFYLSIVRRIKAKQLIKNSLIYKVIFGIGDYFRSIFDGRKFSSNKLTKQLFYRQASFIGISFVLVFMTFVLLFLPPLMLLPPLLEILLIFWFVKGNRETFEAIDRGFNDSLEEQMKAERMKIQLVTNVSHDLKTPLTSIISYADLLSKEEDLSEVSRDYVNILIDKSNRLKNIVADLFDLAKSSSGDIALQLEPIDLKKLIEQTLADMDDEIAKTEIQFKIKLPEVPVMVNADGQKLYRVFQNLIDNALKYALHGTRVFIELETINHKAYVSIKNTASYEMEFTADEILQRFSRADASRTTEGSGLGLSIAESFTQVSGGQFFLSIDGDLFKVTLQFNEILI
ncbi:HAMP domain-containing sensor histidine kinase [Fusibacter bizertensis]|uniref:histidine kinase n=1 Tax=Fusibacter bizertensis TaxID=1488331 RepID=A0ABT6ND12_9FIRM|nr:HAMP domain-containing sensor histidine kinase [Fusibacter bizertensis]MDH8678303.1 HAMP domain-containing sensor histidine kinase [Fusibacter bizertensis]